MIIGSHVSFGKKELLGSTIEAISYGANTFMFYTGAPQNTIRKDINKDITEEALKLMKENNIDINNVICHAPYIVNLANNLDETKYDFSINFLKNELKRCSELGVKYIVLHPGSAVGIERNTALNNIINALNIVLNGEENVSILLETMAGKGTELGCSIEEIKYLLENVQNKDRIGICLDTCHLNDAGYDLSDFDTFMSNFSKQLDPKYIKCIHINDSKNVIGARKDRHANIGYGTIGFDTLNKIVTNPILKDIPKILETPYIGEDDLDKDRIYPPYKFEIKMFKDEMFNKNLMNDIREFYKTN